MRVPLISGTVEVANGSTTYFGPTGSPLSTGTEGDGKAFDNVLAGNITALYVWADQAPGGSGVAVTVRLNASSNLNTVTLTGAASGSHVATNAVSIAGSVLGVKVVNSSGATRRIRWVIIHEPTGGNGMFVNPVFTPNAASESAFGTSVSFLGASSSLKSVSPIAFTAQKLYIRTATATSGSQTYSVELFINGVGSGLKATVGTSQQNGNDTTHAVAIAAGDTLSWKHTSTGGYSIAVNVTICIEMANTARATLMSGYKAANWPASGAFLPMAGYGTVTGGNAPNAAETDFVTNGVRVNPYTFAVCELSLTCTAPGSGKSRTITLRKNGVSQTATITVSNLATSGSDVSHFTTQLSANDTIDYLYADSGSPSAPETTGTVFLAALHDGNPTQIFEKSASNSFSLSVVATPEAWIVREITSGTITHLPGGGRQTIRDTTGKFWHVYRESGSIKVAYSTDGITWTVTDLGLTYTVVGFSMCIGESNAPVLAICREQSANYSAVIYKWNGSAWIFQSQTSVGDGQGSQSLQIIYLGSTYYLVYGSYYSTVRRVETRTSTNLSVGWTSTTLLAEGDVVSSAPNRYRRVALCEGPSSKLHLVYSIRVGGSHVLYYRQYSGGAWGSAETIDTAGTGDNLSDYHSGLSIAVDDQETVHVVGRVADGVNLKLRYFRRVGTWSAENIHASVAYDQGFPSLSLNGRVVVVCWDSAGLSKNVARARRALDGTWTIDTITTDVRDNVQTIHGPHYGSSGKYARGAVGTMRGSEEFFTSFDALAGTAAVAESNFSFSSIASTLRRVTSSSFALGVTATGVYSIGAQSGFSLSIRANLTYELDASSTFNLHQIPPSGAVYLFAVHTLNFSGSAQGVKEPHKIVSHTINFAQSIALTRERLASSGFILSVLAQGGINKQKSASTGFSLAQVLSPNWILKKLASAAFSFTQGATGLKEEGCDTDFVPSPAVPSDEDSILTTYLQGPWGTLTYTVQLRRPEFGNVRDQELQVVVDHTRGGNRRTFARSNTYERITLRWIQLTMNKLLEVRRFLRLTKGQDIRYTDENGHVWRGVVTSSSVPIDKIDRDQGGEFEVEFEGEVVGE